MEQDSPAYPSSASSSTTSRMATKQSFRRLGILSLLLLVLSSCGGKSDLPGGEFGGFGSADLKQEVTIKASAPVQVNFTANTLGDSDIYRDGKLVSQSIYRSEWRDPIAKSHHTTFTHKGSGLYVGVIASRPNSGNSPAAIKVKIEVKQYNGNKHIRTYEKEVTLTAEPLLSSTSEMYQLQASDRKK